MIKGPGFDTNFSLLDQLMTISVHKQKTIAHNIANVDTPGYRSKKLNFEEELLRVVEEKDWERLPEVGGKIVETQDPTLRNDGNNVDIDKEMGLLSRNSLAYSLYTELYSKKLNMLRMAMRPT